MSKIFYTIHSIKWKNNEIKDLQYIGEVNDYDNYKNNEVLKHFTKYEQSMIVACNEKIVIFKNYDN